MNDTKQKSKMGRPLNRGLQKVQLKDLLDKFKASMEIPIPYTFARQFKLLPEDLQKERETK
tara:strand:+ start:517 stop:699 length:183 start_codon:yes stop_codon:yes gene_type:complete